MPSGCPRTSRAAWSRAAQRAAETTVEAVERTWQRPDAGLWELEDRWWTHSRLAVVTGLRALARQAPPRPPAAAPTSPTRFSPRSADAV
ncbi:hypothetical protein SUDANB171_05332 [Streptomyces sp. enrichment culture]|uniref:hypothetical protein n=1 Tax=Streptomyces sp. enrichment culture TaxID=1795815 RepID=UPI003F55FE6B